MIYMDDIIKQSKLEKGIQIGNTEITELMFADDVALLAETPEKLQTQLDRFERACAAAGMKISHSKSEIMLISRNQRNVEIKIQGKILKQVEKFKYLGCQISQDGKLDNEIN